MNLLFDFTVEAEILDQWSAPRPWQARTKEMDFREGGRWLYAMVSPENAKHWSLVQFVKIQPKSSFTAKNSFCDENGNSVENRFSLTKNTFTARAETTTVHIEKKFDDLSVLEMVVSRGFKEGTAAAMNNLDEYFLTLVASK
jgi:PhnB protein